MSPRTRISATRAVDCPRTRLRDTRIADDDRLGRCRAGGLVTPKRRQHLPSVLSIPEANRLATTDRPVDALRDALLAFLVSFWLRAEIRKGELI